MLMHACTDTQASERAHTYNTHTPPCSSFNLFTLEGTCWGKPVKGEDGGIDDRKQQEPSGKIIQLKAPQSQTAADIRERVQVSCSTAWHKSFRLNWPVCNILLSDPLQPIRENVPSVFLFRIWFLSKACAECCAFSSVHMNAFCTNIPPNPLKAPWGGRRGGKWERVRERESTSKTDGSPAQSFFYLWLGQNKLVTSFFATGNKPEKLVIG